MLVEKNLCFFVGAFFFFGLAFVTIFIIFIYSLWICDGSFSLYYLASFWYRGVAGLIFGWLILAWILEFLYDCSLRANASVLKQVRSEKLLTALGLKTQVTVDDTLAILKVWRAKVTLSAR